MTEEPSSGDLRTRQVLVVALAALSGATDAIGLLALGGAFTSVMTGNLVLLGTASTTADGALALSSGTAVLAFCVGVALGTLLAGTPQRGDGVWPTRVTAALTVEGALLAGYATGWWATGADRGATAELLLLATTAVALGVQSSTVQRFGVSGLSTTFLTGTLTGIVSRLATRRPLREVLPSTQVVAGWSSAQRRVRRWCRHCPTRHRPCSSCWSAPSCWSPCCGSTAGVRRPHRMRTARPPATCRDRGHRRVIDTWRSR